jgi:hypothetical protein
VTGGGSSLATRLMNTSSKACVVVGVLANEGDDLAVAVGGLSVLASGLMNHCEAIVAVVHIGEPHQEVEGSLFGLVELSGMNEFGHGVGGIRQFVVALQCILGDTEPCGDGGFQLVDPRQM